jgi:hypothetical protein
MPTTEKRETWSFGAQCGDAIAGSAIEPQRLALRLLFNQQVRKPYSEEVEELSFVLRVDGEISSWQFEGCERLRISRKGRYITVDIGVPEGRWNVIQEADLRVYLATCVREGVELMIAKLHRERITLDERRLRRHVSAALDRYLARDWPKHRNLFAWPGHKSAA